MVSLKFFKGFNFNFLIDENNYKFIFLSLIIILSSIKLFGYVCGFILLIPFLYFYRENIKDYFSILDTQNKLVLGYFSYFIFEAFLGANTLKDNRIIIYWVSFFVIIFLSYILNNYKIKTDNSYKEKFQDVIFKASQSYFIFYFLMNILSLIIFKNEYEIQDNLWIGSATAFNISGIFLFLIYQKWSKERFKLNSWYLANIIFYTFLVLLNEARLGQLYLLIFLITVLLRSIQIKNIINFILICFICFYTFSLGSYGMSKIKNFIDVPVDGYGFRNFNTEIVHNFKYFKAIKSDLKDDNKMKSGDTGRVFELIIGIEKFKSSNKVQQLFGTGWYSSRKTINVIRNKMYENIENINDKEHFINHDDSQISHLQGIVTLLLDTGLIGFSYTIFLFFITIRNVLHTRSKNIDKALYAIYLLVNFFCLFIGYPWNNMPFLLIMLPRGIFYLE